MTKFLHLFLYSFDLGFIATVKKYSFSVFFSQGSLNSAFHYCVCIHNLKKPLITFLCLLNLFQACFKDFHSVFRSVSGKKICSYCNNVLGKGAAMIIESLGLCYHLQCFKVRAGSHVMKKQELIRSTHGCSVLRSWGLY